MGLKWMEKVKGGEGFAHTQKINRSGHENRTNPDFTNSMYIATGSHPDVFIFGRASAASLSSTTLASINSRGIPFSLRYRYHSATNS